jgi:hypothetical protein
VLSQEFGLPIDDLKKALFEPRGNPRVKWLTPAAQQAPVRRVAHQSMP